MKLINIHKTIAENLTKNINLSKQICITTLYKSNQLESLLEKNKQDRSFILSSIISQNCTLLPYSCKIIDLPHTQVFYEQLIKSPLQWHVINSNQENNSIKNIIFYLITYSDLFKKLNLFTATRKTQHVSIGEIFQKYLCDPFFEEKTAFSFINKYELFLNDYYASIIPEFNVANPEHLVFLISFFNNPKNAQKSHNIDSKIYTKTANSSQYILTSKNQIYLDNLSFNLRKLSNHITYSIIHSFTASHVKTKNLKNKI